MRRIGLDFDNTIICYDGVFCSTAKEWGLLGAGFVGNKQQVRDAIRLLPDGEITWQRLQGFVYGGGIGGACSFQGLTAFLDRARSMNDTIVIVSHKTEYGHFDPARINLRQAALQWMRAEGLFDRFGLAAERVFFESTRSEKIARIATLGCDIFVDDLEEVLSDPDFPSGVERILFSEHKTGDGILPYTVCPDWAAVEQVLYR